MKLLKFAISFVVTITLLYAMNRSWIVGDSRLPPLGKFLDPFHGFWQNIESDHAVPMKNLAVSGLTDKVSIAFDSLAIPHIFAQNDEDLYFAQGYVTAVHRLWQMEFQTHAAAGRVSEVIGSGKDGVFLNYDRGQRRIGMVFGAQQALKAMEADPTSKMMIQRYTEGINQYIASLEYRNLPFEYKLLDYTPEPWTPLKCALLLKNMALTLNMGDKDMQMSNSLALFGKETTDLLFPDYEGVTDPIVENPGAWTLPPIKLDSFPPATPDSIIRIAKMPDADPTTGSNNWAVHGSKTATGAPILCGDPHLNLSLPSLWYALQLNTPGANTMGASLPGSPAIIIGFNDSIAWSVTNAQRDLVDWFRVTFRDNTKSQYQLDGKWVAATQTIEAFAVRGQPVFYDTVTYTHWGPIPYDQSYHGENNLKGYALRWIAHDASNEVLTFYKLNRGKNHADYLDALDHYSAPAQNFAFASVGGDIAMRIQGKFPVRRPGEGRFVMDGSKSANGWHAFIPNEQNIQYKIRQPIPRRQHLPLLHHFYQLGSIPQPPHQQSAGHNARHKGNRHDEAAGRQLQPQGRREPAPAPVHDRHHPAYARSPYNLPPRKEMELPQRRSL
jgi:penicillin amidase